MTMSDYNIITYEPETAMQPLWGWMWIFGSEMTLRKRKVGARREKVLLTCSISVVVSSLGGSSSSPESSDEAESRRGGGSLSPRAIARTEVFCSGLGPRMGVCSRSHFDIVERKLLSRCKMGMKVRFVVTPPL